MFGEIMAELRWEKRINKEIYKIYMEAIISRNYLIKVWIMYPLGHIGRMNIIFKSIAWAIPKGRNKEMPKKEWS